MGRCVEIQFRNVHTFRKLASYSWELHVPVSDLNLLPFIDLHLISLCHTYTLILGFVSPVCPPPSILYLLQHINSDERKTVMSNLPSC